MADFAPKVRLFVDAPLAHGEAAPLSPEQAHYLIHVMRLEAGAAVAAFNNDCGEWRALLRPTGKKTASLEVEAQARAPAPPPDVELLFAPLKKARTDFVAEKATELGVRRIRPVLTRFTNAERVNAERLRAHAIEAAEQCGGVYVPAVEEPQPLARLLAGWPKERRILFCDEARDSPPAPAALRAFPKGEPWAVLIGPEGGFSPEERAQLKAMACAVPVSLGPRVLRAETAAVAALTIWQSVLGDWT